MDPVIFFASRPEFENLCCVDVSFTCVENQFSQYLSKNDQSFQAHISKCRELIFTEQDILASPSYDQGQVFNVIMTRDLFKTGRVQLRLQNQGLSINKPYKVGPMLYQSCLRYTVQAKLAPTWNKVGDWYINGKDFLEHSAHAPATKMNLCTNKNEIYVTLCGTLVHSPPLQIEDLDLSEKEKVSLLNLADSNDPTGSVDLQSFHCHVMPSMKQGWISSLSLVIPEHGPFSSYRDLARYWKNMYGYRLPRTDEAILYCQVSFWQSDKGKKFTYPNICLRMHPIKVKDRVDPKPVLKSFLQDLHSRVNTVCGMPLRFAPKIQYPILSLVNCEKAGEKVCLSNKSQNRSGIPYRSSQSVNQSCAAQAVPLKINIMKTQTSTMPPRRFQLSSSINESSSRVSSNNVHVDSRIVTNSVIDSPSANINDQFNTSQMPQKTNINISSAATDKNKLCKNVQLKHGDLSNSSNAGNSSKLIPMFRPKQPQKKLMEQNISRGEKNQSIKIVPLFKPATKPSITNIASHVEEGIKINRLEPTTQKTLPLFSLTSKPSFSAKLPYQQGLVANLASTLKAGLMKPKLTSVFQPSIKPKGTLKQAVTNNKRKNPESIDTPKKAKPTNLMEESELERLARCGQLFKVNTASLVGWLRGKGVACRVKEKKNDLMDKVNSYLKTSFTEE